MSVVSLTPDKVLKIWGKNRGSDDPIRMPKVSPIRAAIQAGTYDPPVTPVVLVRVAVDIGHPELAAYIEDATRRAEAEEEQDAERWDGMS